MEVTALCIRLVTVVIFLLAAHVQKGYTQKDDVALRVTADRLQFFEYESVSLHCEGSAQLRGIRDQRGFIRKCEFGWTTVTCTMEVYETDSGGYWCETERGEKSNTLNITVTAGPVILESPALPVMEGDKVTLSCRHKTASTNLRAHFYRGGLFITSSSVMEMTIKNVSKSDEGLYKCNISGVGESAESWLAVRGTRPLHHGSPQALSPLWVVVSILLADLVLLMVGFLHVRKHRDQESLRTVGEYTLCTDYSTAVSDCGLGSLFIYRITAQ